jgi:hypothetical protein
MQQKLKQAVSISRGVDWNLCACLVKFPPDIVTPEELNRKTGSVNCIRTGIMWLFVFAGAMVLSCTSGLSLSKRNVVFVVSAARVPYILRTLFPGSVTVTTAMLEMFPRM